MKIGFYPRLALVGMRRNRRLYLPYLLTFTGMIAMYYILNFLQRSPTISGMRGGNSLCSMLCLGGWVMSFFACLFLFYTNSFLMRRRKKEFGLYSVLGMGKRHLAMILFWENLFTCLLSLGAGLISGIAFSKLAEMGLIALMGGTADYSLRLSLPAVAMTGGVFGGISLLLLLNSLRQLHFSSAISLLHSENAGERPPRGNGLLGLAGIVLLAAAYYMAVTIREPLTAMLLFFVAVLMVIAGTYLVMISGSVFFCRLLQKNTRYYYRPAHFVSVSSMAYRMKRNGAGLASICILSTMVLVMISSTSALYFGAEDSLHTHYPRELCVELSFRNRDGFSPENVESLRAALTGVAETHGVQPLSPLDCRRITFTALVAPDGSISAEQDAVSSFSPTAAADVCNLSLLSLEDYCAQTGAQLTLASGEALVYGYRTDFSAGQLRFGPGCTYRVKEVLRSFPDLGNGSEEILPGLYVVVDDLDAAADALSAVWSEENGPMQLRWIYAFDTGRDGDVQLALNEDLSACLRAIDIAGADNLYYYALSCRETARDDFYGNFGGLFYLGLILSLTFLLATVLIIYYKQISEGYEDQSRFEIMRHVGMQQRDIRRSINSQLLTVFFLPLLLALAHLAFAFPMIRQLLLLFGLNNLSLFLKTTLLTFGIFSLFYAVVYRATSNAYYGIVSGIRNLS